MASSSHHSSSWEHEVFLCFQGEDTGEGFTSHLYKALVDAGIGTFMGNNLLAGRDNIGELRDRIWKSRISVVVFSGNFASSKWCLDELVEIIECKQRKGQVVFPVFYKVPPSELRNLRPLQSLLPRQSPPPGHLAFSGRESDDELTLSLLEKIKDKIRGDGTDYSSSDEDKEDPGENPQTIRKWKDALQHLAELKGWHFQKGDVESDLVSKIVKKIRQILAVQYQPDDRRSIIIRYRSGTIRITEVEGLAYLFVMYAIFELFGAFGKMMLLFFFLYLKFVV